MNTGRNPARQRGADDSRPPTSGGRHLLVILAAIIAVAALITTIAVLVVRTNDDSASPGSGTPAPTSTNPPGTVPSTSPSTPREPTTAPTPRETTGGPERSALAAVTPFLSAAARLDRQLHAAAVAINASGPPWTAINADTARKVQVAQLEPVARRIPPGLPHDLQQSVILVYSDLSSRQHAMQSFAYEGPVPSHRTTEVLLSELRNGHVAAGRFERDLAATRSLAEAAQPVTAVPKTSRLVAETLLRVKLVDTYNGGCDARGGVVITALPEVRWVAPAAGVPDPTGTIGPYSTAFHAKLLANGTWEVYLLVC